jgi:hypothetical protein
VNENEMHRGMGHLQERRDIYTGFWFGKMKGRHHFEELWVMGG